VTGQLTADVLRYGPHAAQHLLTVTGTRPVAVVLVHGGFWRAEKTAESLLGACGDLAGAGLFAASVEYRTVESGGTWESSSRDVADALTAFAAATGIPLRHTVLVGHSAGGHLALLAAGLLPDLGAVVGLAPVTDLVSAHEQNLGDGAVLGLFGGNEPSAEALREASPLHRDLPSCRIRLLHGDVDQAVPVEQSLAYARRAGVEVRVIGGARHMHLVNPERPAWSDVRAELLSLADVLHV
jgi:acetyl esterase/lipase